jgi:hypothetical protein
MTVICWRTRSGVNAEPIELAGDPDAGIEYLRCHEPRLPGPHQTRSLGLRLGRLEAGSTCSTAYGSREPRRFAIVHSVPEFIWGMSVDARWINDR